MRIAFVVDKCSPIFTGGYEARYLSLAKRLAARNEVRIYTSMETDRMFIESVEFVRSNLPSSRGISRSNRSLPHSLDYSLMMLKCPFGDWSPDVVVIEAIPFLHLETMRRWIRRLGSVIILNVNEAWVDYQYLPGILSTPSKLAIRHLLQTGFSFSDLVITISENTARSLRTHFAVSAVSVVPVGLDSTWLEPSPNSGRNSRRIDFVMVGRVVKIKRHEDFLHALAILQKTIGWDGKAVVIGEGPLLSRLRRLSQELGLADNLELLGEVDETTKINVLHDASIFVLCSEREGFSIATLEAQASGAATVVAEPRSLDVFGVSDIVRDYETGLTYPVGDCEMLAATLARLLLDGTLRTSIGERGQAQAKSYSWNKIAEDFERQLVGLRQQRGLEDTAPRA
jgi:glycosyltransferase involved in cell wall biosynthesis